MTIPVSIQSNIDRFNSSPIINSSENCTETRVRICSLLVLFLKRNVGNLLARTWLGPPDQVAVDTSSTGVEKTATGAASRVIHTILIWRYELGRNDMDSNVKTRIACMSC